VSVGSARPALRLPAATRRPNGSVLVVGEDGRVQPRVVEAQSDVDGSWLVIEGLAADERVVLRPSAVREGQVVVPVEPGAASTTPPQAAL
jgi:hypothetical protein